MSYYAALSQAAYVPDARTAKRIRARGLGVEAAPETEAVPAISTCPVCSYFKAGDCIVCVNDDPHPGCQGCKDGALRWYKRPLVLAVGTGIAVSVLATIATRKLAERGVL